MINRLNGSSSRDALWAAWGSNCSDALVVEASADRGASAFLEDIVRYAGMVGLVATRHVRGEDAAEIIAVCGAAISADAAHEIGVAAARAIAPWGLRYDGELQGSSWTIDRVIWKIVRLPVHTQHPDVMLMLSFLSNSAAETGIRELERLRPLITAHFQLWQQHCEQSVEALAVRSAMEAIEMGVLLVNRSSKIILGNRAAAEILDLGEHLRRSGEGFTAIDLQDSLAVQVALSHSVAANQAVTGDERQPRRSAPILSVRSRSTGKKLLLWFVPAELRAQGRTDCAVVVYILLPGCETSKQLESVCRLHGLSPVETRLVCHITAGKSLQESACEMRIKEQTARGYLKQIFAKTGTRRQAELMRTMLSSLMRMSGNIDPVVLASR